MASKLPPELHSPEQIEAVLFELDAYVALRRRQAAKHKAGVTPKQSPQFNWTSELEAIIGTEGVAAKLSLADLDAKTLELKSWRDLPVVHLTLPVRPPAKLKSDLVAWFRREVSPLLLVKFSVNSGIVGGLVVRTPQRIHDYSFRRSLQDKQSRIPEILKHAK